MIYTEEDIRFQDLVVSDLRNSVSICFSILDFTDWSARQGKGVEVMIEASSDFPTKVRHINSNAQQLSDNAYEILQKAITNKDT